MKIKIIRDKSGLLSRLSLSDQYNGVKYKIMYGGIKNVTSTYKIGDYKIAKSSFRIWLNMNSRCDLVNKSHLRLCMCGHKKFLK